MSVSAAMYAAITGLNAMGTAMSVISNNISNVNTIGFKASRTNFEDLLCQSIQGSTGPQQIGRGVKVAAITQIFSQGSFQTSTQDTDIAITGDGFFQVRNPNSDATYYTRAGNFIFDKSGRMVTPSGYVLQGWKLTNENPPSQAGLSDIEFANTTTSANATTTAQIVTNLDSRSTSKYIPPLYKAWDGSNRTEPIKGTNYSYQTSMRVYDSQGGSHDLSVYFDPDQTLKNVWDYIITCDPAEDARKNGSGWPINSGTPYAGLLQKGTMTFDPTGKIRNITADNLTTFTPGIVHSAVTYSAGWNSASAHITTGTQYSSSVTGTYTIQKTTSSGFPYTMHWNLNNGLGIVNSGNITTTGPGVYSFNDGSNLTFTLGPPANTIASGATTSFTVQGQTATWTSAAINTNGYYTIQPSFILDPGPPGQVPPPIPPKGTAVSQTIAINFGTKNTTGIRGDWTADTVVTTQYAAPSTTMAQTQDGYTAGSLQGVKIDETGIITGTYSNGQNIPSFRIGLE
ncbi:MAG: flagellar hook-basal body complex protein, partial [Deltaproteobacteria bacterium]|nr:flagellar hook-basal body complex protein [Deltaproteobacteria bacterium]